MAERSCFSAGSSRCCARSRRFSPGVNRYNWEAFFLFNAAGGIVWATIFGVGGYLLGRAFEHYARPVGIAALIVAVICAIIAARFIRSHEQALEDEAERALPGPLGRRRLEAAAIDARLRVWPEVDERSGNASQVNGRNSCLARFALGLLSHADGQYVSRDNSQHPRRDRGLHAR